MVPVEEEQNTDTKKGIQKKRRKRISRPKRRFDRVEPHYLPVEEREENFKEVKLGYIKQDEVFVEASRCYTCSKPACVRSCPGKFDVRKMLDLIKEGNHATAANQVHQFYCTPSSFNRICPAFCQDACIAGKRGDPINILNIKRWLADSYEKSEVWFDREDLTGFQVAIIGSGPAGLTAATELCRMGHEVVVFEKSHVLGGMFATGIPEYRLPKDLLRQEIEDIKKLGVKFVTGVTFGVEFNQHDLFAKGYDAILIAHGAHKPKWIGLPGEELDGSIHAIEFLRKVALDKPVDLGKNTIVIGGGDVAIDAVRVATRLGSNARLVYRRSKEEMPATTEEIEETEKENIPIDFLTNPIEIIGDDKVEAVKMTKMKLGEPDKSGRRRPIPIEGSEFVMSADTVIQAVSQEPTDDNFSISGFDLTQWNTFDVDYESENPTFMTNINGIFAAGDNVSGPKTAIEAIAQAKKAVNEIHSYLVKQKIKTPLP